MATLRIRRIASECLRKSGLLSLKEDIVGIRNSPPPQSLRSELEFIREFRCSPNDPTDPTREFTLFLQRQPVGSGPPPFTGQFPPAGVGYGRLLKIRVLPQLGFGIDFTLYFVRLTGSGEPIPMNEGATSTSDQMREIFGVAEPRYGPNQRIFFRTFLELRQGTPLPPNVRITLTIIDD